MYNKKDIEKTLIEFNYFIDAVTLSNFIKNWKIEAIYEDEDGVEFYDNLAIAKLKKGISLKSQGFSNDQIIYHINKLLPEKLKQQEEEVSKKELPTMPASPAPVVSSVSNAAATAAVTAFAGGSELKNVTIDVTHQTLQMLADTIAQKITSDIQEQMKNADFAQQLLEDSSLKKDNECLAQKVEELTSDNKQLAKRVEELEMSKRRNLINFEFFRHFFG